MICMFKMIHYCQPMYLRTFRIYDFTDINMLSMTEKGIRGEICHSFYRYAKANNKYMKDYDEDKDFSYLIYSDKNNLNGWAMVQMLSVKKFEEI